MPTGEMTPIPVIATRRIWAVTTLTMLAVGAARDYPLACPLPTMERPYATELDCRVMI